MVKVGKPGFIYLLHEKVAELGNKKLADEEEKREMNNSDTNGFDITPAAQTDGKC
jgi:hypothetical protein